MKNEVQSEVVRSADLALELKDERVAGVDLQRLHSLHVAAVRGVPERLVVHAPMLC